MKGACHTPAPVLVLLVLTGVRLAASAEGVQKIRDNSFLLEEGYNQEAGVIQHIQAFQYMKDHSWNYTFTEEWPVPRETHQLSVTVPVNRVDSDGEHTGVGDLMVNYRYQLVLKDPVALAPRLSVILPTGNRKKGLGDGVVGIQANIPLSVEVGDSWVTHWNAGATYLPEAKGVRRGQRDKANFNYGASLIYLLSSTCNPLVELAGNSFQSIHGDGFIRRDHSLFINPGLRFAINRPSGLQIVPGIGMPIGIGPSQGEYGVFVYFSLEHPAFSSLL